VFSQPAIQQLLNQYVLVQLYTDAVPDAYQPTTSAEENLKLRDEKFKVAQLPFYVILRPRGNGLYDEVGRYEEGRITDEAGFMGFLSRPLAAAQAENRVQAFRQDREGALALP
jgi:hypothetical protein